VAACLPISISLEVIMQFRVSLLLMVLGSFLVFACGVEPMEEGNQDCQLVREGFGPEGELPVAVEEITSGLDVPWGVAFLPDGEILITERPGRVRLFREGRLEPASVAEIDAVDAGEGGLLGLVLHPEFADNRLFYLYYTVRKAGGTVNRVERWQLAPEGTRASSDRIILDDIPAARFHNGGRLRFGPDGMLYVGTGDAGDTRLSQEWGSTAGKILRLTPDGEVPGDNPLENNPGYITGIRNTQGFDWWNDNLLLVTDHGPSGEMGRRGHDEVNVAQAGDNLGWPTIYGCETREGMVTPILTWRQAVPPGGAAVYRGNAIPEWNGSLIVAALGSRTLHRVVLTDEDPPRLESHEVYFRNELGRLREIITGPDGELYLTTSNCDGRGNCPDERDRLLKIVPR
jgi:aldose sugar dehydrogenase